uniref:Uncharacterized protein n=1 Tax=Oryza nivara TaxID=4536 RepID=A0A0E0I684_ORYNI
MVKAAMTMRTMRTKTARKEAMTAPLVRWQKPWNCKHMGTQLARRLPSCATYTIAAAADAAAVSKPTMMVSQMSSRSLTPVALELIMMVAAEKGSDSTIIISSTTRDLTYNGAGEIDELRPGGGGGGGDGGEQGQQDESADDDDDTHATRRPHSLLHRRRHPLELGNTY